MKNNDVNGESQKSMVLIHSWGSDPTDFRKIKKYLNGKLGDISDRDYSDSTYYLDYSECTSFREAQEKLDKILDNLEDVLIVAYSMGVCVTLDYLREYSGTENKRKINSMLLLDMSLTPVGNSETALFDGRYTREDAEKSMELLKSSMIDFYLEYMYKDEYLENPKKSRRIVKFLLYGKNRDHIVNMWDDLIHKEYMDCIDYIDFPIYFLMSEDEKFVSNKSAEMAVEKLKKSNRIDEDKVRFSVIENTSHSMVFQEPAKIAEIILDLYNEM